jgi:hypothetical protein
LSLQTRRRSSPDKSCASTAAKPQADGVSRSRDINQDTKPKGE